MSRNSLGKSSCITIFVIFVPVTFNNEDMYRQIFIPSEQNNSIVIPRKWYGQEVEVIVFPTAEEQDETQQPVDYADIRQVRKMAQKEDVQEIKKIFEQHLFSMKDFKFNRDEANRYE
jgi:hypothetical protein